MADQLRADYLSCYGHPALATPNADALAERGVRFSSAYVQAPVCGPSRMSFYTGRYMSSHGSVLQRRAASGWRDDDRGSLTASGLACRACRKTYMVSDRAGLRRLGVDPRSIEGVLASECGFEPYERDDGLWPDQSVHRTCVTTRICADQVTAEKSVTIMPIPRRPKTALQSGG